MPALLLALLLPCPQTDPTSPPASRPTETLPFELVAHQIFLTLPLADGGTCNLLLDTGATPAGIDLQLAREQGWLESEEPVGNIAGVGEDEIPVYEATVRGLSFGSTEIDPLRAAASVVPGILSRRLGRPLHGILGDAFLAGRRIRIDYPRRLVVLEPEVDEPPADAYATRLELVPGDVMPLLRDFRVNDVLVPVSLDTGSSLVLELFPAAARRIELGGEPGESVSVTGARGRASFARARADLLTLGELRLLDQEVLLTAEQRGPAARQGNLGNGFLKRFVLTLDYRERTLVLAPPSS